MALVEPLWTYPVGGEIRQTLEFRTDLRTSAIGTEVATKLRTAPRQRVAFDTLVEGHTRRHLENALLLHGGRPWHIPLPMFECSLAQKAFEGSDLIYLDAPEVAITPGAELMLITEDGSSHEQVIAASTLLNRVHLMDVLGRDWPPGTRVHVLARARFTRVPTLERFTGDAAKASVEYACSEDMPWPMWEGEIYRDHPVLTYRPAWNSAPSFDAARELTTIDVESGPVDVTDFSGIPFLGQTLGLGIAGRSEIDRFIALLHFLAGRYRPIWVPQWAAGLRLASGSPAGSQELLVEESGLSDLAGELHRRDVRIEYADGQVSYRRAVSVANATNDTESVLLDAPLSRETSLANTMLVSFMSLSRLDSDIVALRWWSPELLLCDLSFMGANDGL